MKRLLSLSLLLISGFVNANTLPSVECSSCSSDINYESLAIQKVLESSSGNSYNIGEVLIINYAASELRQYEVHYSPGEPGIPSEFYAFRKSISPSLSQQFSTVVHARAQVQSFFDSYHTNIPADISKSAYDLLGASYNQTKVSNYFVKNQTLRQHIAHYTASSLAVFGKVVNVNFVVELRFSDNSKASFRIAGINSSGDLDLKLVDITDVDGNKIKDSKQQFSQGSYSFAIGGADAINAFLSAASRLGVPITLRRGGGGGGDVSILDCGSSNICKLSSR